MNNSVDIHRTVTAMHKGALLIHRCQRNLQILCHTLCGSTCPPYLQFSFNAAEI